MAYTTIDDPTIYFNTKLFTGNNSANNSITGVGFQPDFIWFKNRDAANNHCLVDSVRGRKALNSDLSSAETTLNADKDFQSFDSDGFTVDVVEQFNSFNKSGDSIVTWNWKAGGSASSNSNGSITTSVSANTTAGFSIVSWTGNGTDGASIGHGLVNPNLCIIKRRDASGHSWFTGGYPNTSLFANDGDHLNLDSTGALSNSSTKEIDLSTNSGTTCTFVDSGNDININGGTFIGYFFKNIKGYSKVGSYTGNGTNNNGSFFYCGFSPSVVIIKASSSSRNWVILDNKRLGYNDKNYRLFPNLTNAEDTTSGIIDFTANGFKLMSNNNTVNESGVTYIVMAFAESPFVNSNGVPTNAR